MTGRMTGMWLGRLFKSAAPMSEIPGPLETARAEDRSPSPSEPGMRALQACHSDPVKWGGVDVATGGE